MERKNEHILFNDLRIIMLFVVFLNKNYIPSSIL